MLTEGTELTGERNVDWRNRAADPVTGRKAVLAVLQGIAFCLLTVCTVLLKQCHAAECCWRNQQVLSQETPRIFSNPRFSTAFTSARRSVSIQFMPLIPFNSMLPSTPKSSTWSISLRCPHQNPASSRHTYMLYAPPI